MKKILLMLLTISSFISAFSQDCDAFFPAAPKSKWEMKMYNAKGKDAGTIKYEITERKSSASKQELSVKQEVFNEKGKSAVTNQGTYTCTTNGLIMDMRSRTNMDEQNMNFEMRVKEGSGYLELPHNLNAGQSLPDGQMEGEIYNNGSPMGTFSYKITNRKVLAKESVTVLAGTFDCYKVEEMFEGEHKMIVNIRFKTKNVYWFAKGIGQVKSEAYRENGKLVSKTELSKIE